MEAEMAEHEVKKDLLKLAAGERQRKRGRADAHSGPSRWRSPGTQQSYASKLLHALRHAAARDRPSYAWPRSRTVRETADRVLAFTARGRRRWSRAILSNCRTLKLHRKSCAVAPGFARPRKTWSGAAPAMKKAPALALEGKVKLLGRLVPGCRRLLLPSLLEEASDYIVALEMQVRAMSALAEVLSSLGGGTGGAPQDRLGPGFSSSPS